LEQHHIYIILHLIWITLSADISITKVKAHDINSVYNFRNYPVISTAQTELKSGWKRVWNADLLL